MSKLFPVEFQGERILTTEQLAQIYETETKNIQMNHANNPGKFIVGKHYFKLEGAELKEFKNLPNIVGLVDKRAPSLILWTKRGASRHCKMLGTDKAWEQFDILEENYFNVKPMTIEDMIIAQAQSVKELISIHVPREARHAVYAATPH